jgi:alpha-L-rhamnosidase
MDAGFDDSRWRPAVLAQAPEAAYEDALRDKGPLPDPWLRKSFELEAEVVRATAWVASLGYHELHANGAKVGEAVLAPGVSELSRRVRWVAYDLSEHLRRGRNALGLWLSAGWARFERFGVARAPLVLFCADVELANGRTLRIVSDGSWRVRASPSTHLGGWGFGDFGGERWDAGVDEPDWCAAEFDDTGWEQAHEHDVAIALSARRGEPDREVEELAPVAIEARGPGVFRVDMGRSFTGFLEARLRGEPGASVTLTWSEREEEETTYAQRSECVLDAHGRATFRNRFDYAAGRWITLRGPIEEPQPGDVRGWLVRSGYARATKLECSDPLLQRIHDTITWTFECLSQGGILADCPHRERLGYGGDAHATLGTGLTHFALGRFYRDWLEDWRDVQGADGGLPYTAPTYEGGGGPAWSGIVAYLPWELYLATGARRVLAESYPAAKRWLEFVAARMRDGLLEPYGDPVWGFLGDWVPPGRGQGPEERVDARSTLFFNNAYLVLCYGRMARAGKVLGLDAEACEWRRRADELRATLHARFFDAERASYANGEQPYLALALLARVVPDELRPAVVARLEHEIRVVNEGHVDSGIHGTAFLLRALLEEERHDLVLELARQTSYPGWGHMLAQGATTIWEQWDGVHSRLHSSFLSLGEWFVQGLAGIRPDPERPGYEHVLVRPAPVGDLASARARFDSVRGPIEVEWKRADERFTLRVSIPPGSRATVFVPTDDAGAVLEGDEPAQRAVGVTARPGPPGAAVFEVESGRYEFRAPLRAGSRRAEDRPR